MVPSTPTVGLGGLPGRSGWQFAQGAQGRWGLGGSAWVFSLEQTVAPGFCSKREDCRLEGLPEEAGEAGVKEGLQLLGLLGTLHIVLLV